MLEVCRIHREDDNAKADIGIKASTIDWSNKLRSLIDQTCFEFIDVSYFGAVNFLPQNTPDAVFC